MITIICATNRPKNQTLKVVDVYEQTLLGLGQEVNVLKMGELPANFLDSDGFGDRSDEVKTIIETKLNSADRLVVVAPEYNGSYPGVFKLFIDSIPPKVFEGKKAALVGVATGRAGNLRGLDHLTDVLHHLKVEVYSGKVPISKLDDLQNEQGEIDDEATLNVLQRQAEGFLKF